MHAGYRLGSDLQHAEVTCQPFRSIIFHSGDQGNLMALTADDILGNPALDPCVRRLAQALLMIRDVSPTSIVSRPTQHPFPSWRSGSSFRGLRDRKSTRLNSSHQIISYAVFCL